MKNIKRKIITYFAIYKIIQKIKKSRYYAYNIGKELFIITQFLYNKEITNNTYEDLIRLNGIEDFIVFKYLYSDIIFDNFIQILSNKIFNKKIKYLTYFLRGYYLNNINSLYSTNINKKYLNFNYFVLYDFHPYFLEQIYKYINLNNTINNKIKFLINLDEDKYSINDFTDKCIYKLVFIHKIKYYNNSIKNLLKFIFYNINDINKLDNNEEKRLFNIYYYNIINDNYNY